MPKSQLNETESLDDKIKRIRKKNEEIERRRLEVEADKQTAAKLNALVQLSAPKEDWPPPRSFTIIEEDKERQPNNSHENTRDRNRGNVTSGDSAYEGKKPPPDPAYRFLADDDRDPLPTKRSSRYHQSPPRRGQAASRSRGRGNKMNVRDNPPGNVRGTPGYEAWREERNRIDEERIRRQRTAQGQWRREWDSQKSENDWQSSLGERSAEHNPTQKSTVCSNVPSESPQKKLIARTKEETRSENTRSGNIAEKIPNFPSGVKAEPMQKNYFVSHQKSDENTKTGLSFGKNIGKNAASPFINQAHPLKVHASPNDSRVVQNSGNSLQISFGSDSVSQKVPPRRAGSGRLGPPLPAASATGHSRRGATAAAAPMRGRADGLPQRRARRRIAPQRKSSSTGDDSWEDADEHSDGEGGGKASTGGGGGTDQRTKSGALKATSAAHEEEEGVETTSIDAAAVASSPEGKPTPPGDDDASPSSPSPHPDDAAAASSVQCDSLLGAQNSDTPSVVSDDNSLLEKNCDAGSKEDNVLTDDVVDDCSVGDLEGEYVLENPEKGVDVGLCETPVDFEGKSQLHDLHTKDESESVPSDLPTNNTSDLVESNDNVCEEVDSGRIGREEKDTVDDYSVVNTEILQEEEKTTCVETEVKTVIQGSHEIEDIGFVDKDELTDLRIVKSIESEDAEDLTKNEKSGAENNTTHDKVSVHTENLGVIITSERKNSENLSCHADDSSGQTEITLVASKQFEDKLQDQTTQEGTINASDVKENVISDLGTVSPNTCDTVVTTEDKRDTSIIEGICYDKTEVLSNSQDEYSLKNEVQGTSESPICTTVPEREDPETKCTQEKLPDFPNTNKSVPSPEKNSEIGDPSTSKNATKETTVID